MNKDDKEMIKFLRERIQKQQIVFNEKSDLGTLHQSLDSNKNKRGLRNDFGK